MKVPCISTWGAIEAFFARGLEPGGFATALLKGDRGEAIRRSHALMTEDDVDALLAAIEEAGYGVVGFPFDDTTMAQWIEHEGIKGRRECAALLRLSRWT